MHVRRLWWLVIAALIAGCGHSNDNSQPKCNTQLPQNAVLSGTITFQPGGKDVKGTSGLVLSSTIRGGVSVDDKDARVGIAVEGDTLVTAEATVEETIILNGTTVPYVIKTGQGCVVVLPAGTTAHVDPTTVTVIREGRIALMPDITAVDIYYYNGT